MERNEIIKALEFCSVPKLTKCEGCPREEEDSLCMYRLNKDALSLIKELTEENEKIGIENFDLVCKLSRIKEDTVREMRERLKERAYTSNDWSHGEHPMVVELDDIDQIAEEMLSDGN